jgi:2,5-diamino-6-(ribosylamino)-4(3H)-pyrimidinone 5'-phosphate reductase
MPLPRVVVQNEVSVDGAIHGFEVHMGVYYGLARQLGTDAHLFGSETMITADFGQRPETPADCRRPQRTGPDDDRQVWFIPDSRGRLTHLHLYRNSDWCFDVVMLISRATPASYREYLEARDYDYIVAGEDRVDLREALEAMYERFGVRGVRVDSGGILAAALLAQGLVDEISLLVSPVVVGREHAKLFRSLSLQTPVNLRLARCELVGGDKNLVHLLYEVRRAE